MSFLQWRQRDGKTPSLMKLDTTETVAGQEIVEWLSFVTTTVYSLPFTVRSSPNVQLRRSIHISIQSISGDLSSVFAPTCTHLKLQVVLAWRINVATRPCFQVFLPINKHKLWMYWHLLYPWGIADTRREDLIDLDECSVFVETTDTHMCKAYIGNQVRQAGSYQKPDKWNLLLVISAAERWAEMLLEGSTTSLKTVAFVLIILADMGPGTPLRHRCFIVDTLYSHHNVQMSALIFADGHCLAYCTPYYPDDGPIKYIFNKKHYSRQRFMNFPTYIMWFS